MSNIKLHKLHCFLNDETDADEVFLKYKGNKIWPLSFYKSIFSGELNTIDVTLRHDNDQEPIIIELWDYDLLSPNDLLGTFHLSIGSETYGKFQATMKPEGGTTASYLLEWEIL